MRLHVRTRYENVRRDRVDRHEGPSGSIAVQHVLSFGLQLRENDLHVSGGVDGFEIEFGAEAIEFGEQLLAIRREAA